MDRFRINSDGRWEQVEWQDDPASEAAERSADLDEMAERFSETLGGSE